MTTLEELLALLPDNSSGAISAADMRIIVTNLYDRSGETLYPGPFTDLAVVGSFTAFPTTPLVQTVSAVTDRTVLVNFGAYIDTNVNNNDVSLAVELSGATVKAPGAVPAHTLRIGGKTLVAATLCLSYIENFNAGDTDMEIKYKASQAGTDVSDVFINAVLLA
jgi:hypothetical protein